MDIVEVDAVVARKDNPYIADVQELIKVTQSFKGEEGKAPAGKFVVPNKDASKTIFYIQQAAIGEGVTARIASPLKNGVNSKGNPERQPVPDTDKNGNETGMTTLLFKITKKRQENGRKPRATKDEATAE